MRIISIIVFLISFLVCSSVVQGQQLVRTYTFTNNENCNVPDGSALSYEDIETLTEISLDSLKKIRVLEGNIFFAGQGFRRSVLMEYAKCGKKIFETDPEFNSYKKIITGTKVIFKACVFLNADGTMTSKKTKVLIINNG